MKRPRPGGGAALICRCGTVDQSSSASSSGCASPVLWLSGRRHFQRLFVQTGGADIVEQLGDLEFRGGLFLGGQFLDRLAGGLKFGLFGGAGDVQRDIDLDLGVQAHDAPCAGPVP